MPDKHPFHFGLFCIVHNPAVFAFSGYAILTARLCKKFRRATLDNVVVLKRIPLNDDFEWIFRVKETISLLRSRMWRFVLSIFNFGAAKISICHPLELPYWLYQPRAVMNLRQCPQTPR